MALHHVVNEAFAMSTSIEWGNVAAWTSAVIGVLTLGVLWWQMRSVRLSVQGSTYQNICSTMIGIDKFFAENPRLRPYFYGGKTLAGVTPLEREELNAVAEMVVDFFYDVFYQRDLMSQQTFQPYSSWMRKLYMNSPLIREFIPTGTYDDAFVKHLQAK
jgi:hypothetical protein